MINKDELFKLSKKYPDVWVFKLHKFTTLAHFIYMYDYENIRMTGSSGLTILIEAGYISFEVCDSSTNLLVYNINITFKGMWLMWNIESLWNNASNTKTN